MATLEHIHYIRRDQAGSQHLDSRGVLFGRDEHKTAASEFDWPEDTLVEEVPHEHGSVTEFVHPINGLPHLVSQRRDERDEDPEALVFRALAKPNTDLQDRARMEAEANMARRAAARAGEKKIAAERAAAATPELVPKSPGAPDPDVPPATPPVVATIPAASDSKTEKTDDNKTEKPDIDKVEVIKV